MGMHSRARGEHGNAVLFVAIALAVLAIIGLAAVEFTGRDLGVARTYQRRTMVERCSLAARNWVQANYRFTNASAAALAPGAQLVITLNKNGDDTVQMVFAQHLGGQIAGLPPHPMAQQLTQNKDLTNSVVNGSANGGGTNAPALCRELTASYPDGGGREAEFEFQFSTL